jgi:hypothetical protein
MNAGSKRGTVPAVAARMDDYGEWTVTEKNDMRSEMLHSILSD